MNTPIGYLFVYGTLRRTGPLEGWLGSSVLESRPATASGGLYSLGAYPAARFDEEGTIVGELFTVEMSEDVIACIQMEYRAGYELVEIEVTIAPEGSCRQRVQKAWAFHYPDTSRLREHIAHGDWFKYESEHPVRGGFAKLT